MSTKTYRAFDVDKSVLMQCDRIGMNISIDPAKTASHNMLGSMTVCQVVTELPRIIIQTFNEEQEILLKLMISPSDLCLIQTEFNIFESRYE